MRPAERLLERLEHVRPSGAGWLARCPAHPDKHASLTIGEGADGRALVRCHKGCSAEAVAQAAGLELRDLFADEHDENSSIQRRTFQKSDAASPARPTASRPELRAGEADVERFRAALLGDERALARLEELRGWTREAVERLELGLDGDRVTFPVRDAGGALVGLLRYRPNPDRRNGDVKLLAERGSRRELYPAPERIAAGEGFLWLLEGEPDAVRAVSLGLPAVAVPGVQGWRSSWAERFRGRRVVVAFDCDREGREAAQRVAAELAGVAAEVRVLDLDPAAEDGFDLSDFARLATGAGERAEARRILERAAEIAPRVSIPAPKESALPQRNETAPERLPFGPLARVLKDAPPEPAWCWRGFLAPGAVTVLASRPKAGKTTLVFALMAALAEGAPTFLELPTRQTGALLLSEERPGTLAQKAARFLSGSVDSLGAGKKINGPHLLMRHQTGGLDWPLVVAQAADYCREHELGLLAVDVFDKWPSFGRDDENSSGAIVEAVGPLLEAAAEYELAVLLVTHQRKAAGQYGEAVRGSNALTGAVDIVVELERAPESLHAGEGARVLRAVSRFDSTPEELVVCLTEHGYVSRGEPAAVRAEGEREQVFAALGESAETVAEIAEAAELTERATRRHLDELLELGRAERVGAGKKGDPYRFRRGGAA